MLIHSLIAAPTAKKMVIYDIEKDELVIQLADVIGIVEIPSEDEDMVTITPMYLCSDSMGIYTAPQLFITFLDLVDKDAVVDLGKYIDQIDEVKRLIKEETGETVEVETTGNVSRIRRFEVKKKKEDQDDDKWVKSFGCS